MNHSMNNSMLYNPGINHGTNILYYDGKNTMVMSPE